LLHCSDAEQHCCGPGATAGADEPNDIRIAAIEGPPIVGDHSLNTEKRILGLHHEVPYVVPPRPVGESMTTTAAVPPPPDLQL